MSTQPLSPPRQTGVEIVQRAEAEENGPDFWHASPYTDAEIDAIFDVWTR